MSCARKISGKTISIGDSISGESLLKNVDGVPVCFEEFIFRVDTSLGDGSNDFSIPLPSGLSPDMVVKWGDGVTEIITDSSVASLTHTYSSSGQYDIIIAGDMSAQFGRGNTTHIEKVTSILNWGLEFEGFCTVQQFSNLSSIQATDYPEVIVGQFLFQGCTSLNADLSFWDTSSWIGDFNSVFNGCTSFNGDVSGWSISDSTQDMFRNCTSFNQDLTMWDVSAVTIMQTMFFGTDSFDFNNINGWQFGDGCDAADMFDGRYGIGTYTQAEIAKFADLWESFDFPTQGENVNASAFMISTSSLEQMLLPEGSFPDADVAIDNLVAKGWTGISGRIQPAFKLLLDTSLGGNTVTFPGTTGNNRIIDWGDGTWERIANGSSPSHTYSSTGQYTCTIATDSFMGFQKTFSNTGVTQLIEVTDTTGLPASGGGISNRFADCVNLTFVPDEYLSRATDVSRFLLGCTSFNQDVSGWDVSGVSNMSQMFEGATSFDQDISGWVVNGVSDMRQVFKGATSFNQDISGWDVSNATLLFDMFRDATAFDQNLGAWQFKDNADINLLFFSSGMSDSNIANTIIGWNSNPNQGTGISWTAITAVTLSESATVPVDGYDGASAKAAYDNIVLATGSGGLGWTGNPNITWVA